MTPSSLQGPYKHKTRNKHTNQNKLVDPLHSYHTVTINSYCRCIVLVTTVLLTLWQNQSHKTRPKTIQKWTYAVMLWGWKGYCRSGGKWWQPTTSASEVTTYGDTDMHTLLLWLLCKNLRQVSHSLLPLSPHGININGTGTGINWQLNRHSTWQLALFHGLAASAGVWLRTT